MRISPPGVVGGTENTLQSQQHRNSGPAASPSRHKNVRQETNYKVPSINRVFNIAACGCQSQNALDGLFSCHHVPRATRFGTARALLPVFSPVDDPLAATNSHYAGVGTRAWSSTVRTSRASAVGL